MKKILITVAFVIAVLLCTSCTQKPKKNTNTFTGTDSLPVNQGISTEEITEADESAEPEDSAAKEAPEQPEVELPEIPDTHVYTADELTDELIREKLIGYWEFNTFGYLGGYNFFESGFLQLVLEREVNQTGIFMVKNKGVYFSLDSKSWDEDVLVVQSVSNTELRGTFGEDTLVLTKSDASLIKENSGLTLNGTDNQSTVIDAASEIEKNVKAN